MRPRRLAVPAVLLLILCSLAACSNQGTASSPVNFPSGARITVAMVTHGQAFDPFWALVQKGAQTAASQFNVKLEYQSPNTTDPQAQAAMITQAAAQKPAAMVVTIPDPAVLASPIRQVSSAGIPVVVVNVGDGVYQSVGALTFVGQPDYQAGEQAGKVMAAVGVRKALCVIHEAQNTALIDRCAGFTKQLSASGGTVQTLHVNGAQLHQAQSAIEQALKRDHEHQWGTRDGHHRVRGRRRRPSDPERLRAGQIRHVRRLLRRPDRGAERPAAVRDRSAAFPGRLRCGAGCSVRGPVRPAPVSADLHGAELRHQGQRGQGRAAVQEHRDPAIPGRLPAMSCCAGAGPTAVIRNPVPHDTRRWR